MYHHSPPVSGPHVISGYGTETNPEANEKKISDIELTWQMS